MINSHDSFNLSSNIFVKISREGISKINSKLTCEVVLISPVIDRQDNLCTLFNVEICDFFCMSSPKREKRFISRKLESIGKRKFECLELHGYQKISNGRIFISLYWSHTVPFEIIKLTYSKNIISFYIYRLLI